MSKDVPEKRRNVRTDRTEVLLMLRSYQVHPASYPEILQTIRNNDNLLSTLLQQLYKNKTDKKLQQRIREKFNRLLQNLNVIDDEEIRYEANKIVEQQRRRTSKTTNFERSPQRPRPYDESDDDDDNDDDGDIRRTWARSIDAVMNKTMKDGPNMPIETSTSSAAPVDKESAGSSRRPSAAHVSVAPSSAADPGSDRRQTSKKRSIRDLIRENEELKNKVLKKLLQQREIMDTDSE